MNWPGGATMNGVERPAFEREPMTRVARLDQPHARVGVHRHLADAADFQRARAMHWSVLSV